MGRCVYTGKVTVIRREEVDLSLVFPLFLSLGLFQYFVKIHWYPHKICSMYEEY